MRHPAFIGLLIALSTGSPGWADPPAQCTVADDAGAVATPLPHVAAKLRPGETLNVLAIGSANLFRPEATFAPGSITTQAVQGAKQTTVPPAQVLNEAASGTAFPQQMASALEKLVPGVSVKITTRGGRGLSAIDQRAILSDMVDHEKFQLVLWQTGTVEAVRNLPPSEFAQTLADGAEKATDSGSRRHPDRPPIQPLSTDQQRSSTIRTGVPDGRIDAERRAVPPV